MEKKMREIEATMTKTDGDDYNAMTKFDRQRSETTQPKVYQREDEA